MWGGGGGGREQKVGFGVMFRPGHRAVVFVWENFHPGYRDLGRKNRDLGNRVSPAPHMNTSIFLQKKEWRGEISQTEPGSYEERES